MKSFYDIVIVGGGTVGAAFACAVAKETALSIAILEAKSPASTWSANHYHHRVSAISLSSQRIFSSLDLWPDMQKLRVSPFKKIAVWEADAEEKIVFDSAEMKEAFLGFIIENNLIQSLLAEKIKQHPQIDFISPVHLTEFRKTNEGIEMEADGQSISASLAIAADGAHSWLRMKAGIEVDRKDYEQHALVTNIETALPHQEIARQIFLETGPLAFLPLAKSNLSSIVWSLPTTLANELQALSQEAFKIRLKQAFPVLGDILEIEERFSFPLFKQQAKHYVEPGLALMGDAAHVIHPLAGQGVNMGLLDAASLAELIVDAQKKARHFADFSMLRQYERWRKADNLAMCVGVDALKKLFASDKKILRSLRSKGLSVVNQTPSIKRFFMRWACGERDGLPFLAR